MAKTKKVSLKKESPKKATPAKATTPKATPMKQTAKVTSSKAHKEVVLKPTAKSTKKPEPKVKMAVVSEKKGDKKSEKILVTALEVVVTGPTEEEEEEMETAAAKGTSAAEAGLALAAATATADTAAGTLKNFRHHPDIENFYRFIFENDLRYEALEIIDVIVSQRGTQQAVKVAKGKSH